MLKDRAIIVDGKQSETINSKNLSNLFDINIDVIQQKGYWHVYRKTKEL
tara:strand:- start:503 stop:649 length:147 start_codon:yes stop_codon:yes gene_type:complete